MTSDDAVIELVHGDASKVIHELSDSLNADLIVMGTVGRTGVPGLLAVIRQRMYYGIAKHRCSRSNRKILCYR
ncbi:universal stress protein [Candidatus Thiodiazotropha endoloripes]|uniref:universal stress protein n=1 Tax=Candidatus Thiodiazotropha endoloripes TaxID=1818881 RepID=UPI00090317B2